MKLYLQSGRNVLFLTLLLALLAFGPEAHAQDSNAFQAPFLNLVQAILDLFNGGLARMLAILAIIGLGLSAMIGKLTWAVAIRVVVGIVLVFGAAAIVGLITGNAGNPNFGGTSHLMPVMPAGAMLASMPLAVPV